MRNVPHGSIQAAVRGAISAAGGLECASNDLGMSVSNLSRASGDDEDRPGGLGVNHLHRLGRIVPEAAIPIARHFAALGGGYFQPCPHDGALSGTIADLTQEFSQILSTHGMAMSEQSALPNDYTPEEARVQLTELDKLMTIAAALRAALLKKAGGAP